MRLEGLHHITAITGDAPRNVDFYARRDGPADGGEDGQPGRPERLPPVLRRRGRDARRRHHLLRVPGRRAGPRRRRHGAPRRLARGLAERRSTSGPSGWASRAGDGATPSAGFADPEGLEHELRRDAVSRRAAERASLRDPARARAAGLRRRPRPQPAARRGGHAAREPAGRRALGDDTFEIRGEQRGGTITFEQRRRARPAGRRHHPPHRVGLDERGPPEVAREARGGRRAHVGHGRPPLLPLDLLPRAGRHPLRDRRPRAGLHARPAAGGARHQGDPAALAGAAPRRDRGEPDAAARPAR